LTARILIVDDVLPNRKLLKAKLEREYFDVLTAASGQEALDLVEREQPDLVLLDVMMPDMDGMEVCRRIKKNPASAFLPVVLVTALDHPEDRVAGLQAGADDFLTKPLDELSLVARVRSLVRLKFTVDELRSRDMYRESDDCALHNSITDARVLLLDPHGDDVKLVRECLQHFGRVDVARDAAELEMISKRVNYDCVILPMSHDGQDGLRIASRLRTAKETRFVPILMIAADDDKHRLIKALELGVNDYLMRPMDALELVARTRTQMRRKRFVDSLRENLQLSIKLATTDSVTGLHNRHYMTSQLQSLIEACRDSDRALSVAILDLDKFKSVNDTHGHTAGDLVLEEFAKRISQSIRGIDLAARYGGEEFVVIMPDTTIEVAAKVGERLRALTASSPFTISADGTAINVTVSIGLAELEAEDENLTALLERADEALYDAKHGGRNQVCVAQRSDLTLQQAS